MNRIFIAVLAIVLSVSFGYAQEETASEEVKVPDYFIKNLNDIPDMTQSNIRNNFPNKGEFYDGPAVASNIVMWLGENGFPDLLPKAYNDNFSQIKIARELGSDEYMNTDPAVGTSLEGFLTGLDKYITVNGYEYKRLQYQGIGECPEKFGTGVRLPDLNWIKQGISSKGGVWLYVGWYQYDSKTKEYKRFFGSWVSAVGYGVENTSRRNPAVMILHDPNVRAGEIFENEYIRTYNITKGSLVGEFDGFPINAVGFLKTTRGMSMPEDPEGIDNCIIEGAVILEM